MGRPWLKISVYPSVLAVANALGLDAIGVDHAAKRCRAARALVVDVT